MSFIATSSTKSPSSSTTLMSKTNNDNPNRPDGGESSGSERQETVEGLLSNTQEVLGNISLSSLKTVIQTSPTGSALNIITTATPTTTTTTAITTTTTAATTTTTTTNTSTKVGETKIQTPNTDETTIETSPFLASNISTSTKIIPSPSDTPRESGTSQAQQSSLAKPNQSLGNSLKTEYQNNEDSTSKSSDSSSLYASAEALKTTPSSTTEATEKPKSASKISERAKKKSWYNVLYPSYKSRSKDFKKLFKEVPNDERLIVDYSCALQRDILVHGRLYVSQNYLCFHANIFRWETYLSIKWKDVTSITKEKTALVIPNAISVCTEKDKHFFASFTTRDKAFLMLFRVWQNTLMNKPMLPQEMWQWVHNCYGDELGLTTDDEDYIDPLTIPDLPNESDSLFEQNCDDYQSQKNNLNRSKNNNNTSSSDNKASDSNSAGRGSLKDKKSKMSSKEIKLMNVRPDESPKSSNAASSGTGSTPASGEKNPPTAETAKRKMSKNTRHRDESLNKNSETLPTDMSDSSDSEENNIPFVSTVECTSTHEGRQLMHTILPINIDTLFSLLFSKSKFLVEFHEMRKSTDIVFNDWEMNSSGLKTRTVCLTVTLAQSVGPKNSRVTEHQVMRECSKPGELYSIDIDSTNAGIPYADSFGVLLHYCLVKTIDDHTMLSVHAQIKYKKSIWGVVKGFIEKNAWAGLEDFYNALHRSLQSETCIPPAKGKGRRPRRGTAAVTRAPVEETVPVAHVPEVVQPSIPSPVQVLSEPTSKYKWISLFVLILLFLLILINVILLLKLWKLEDRIHNDSNRRRLPNLSQIKNLPSNHEDWIELLRQQEILHETELKKWHTVLQTAIELLKKTEKTLAELLYINLFQSGAGE